MNYSKRNMEEYEFDLPHHIAETLVSILLPSSVTNEHMRNFIKQLSGFVHQKENKIEKEEKVIKIAYDSTFARGLPAECFIISTLEFHLQSILATDNHHLRNSVQYTMKNILNIVYMYLPQTNIEATDYRQLLIPMLTDLRTEPLTSDLLNICKIIFEDYGNQNLENLVEKHLLCQSYVIFKGACSEGCKLSTPIQTNLLTTILDFWCSLANEKAGKSLFFEMFLPSNGKPEFIDILFSFMNTKMNHRIIIKILHLFVELLDTENDGESVNEPLCAAILKLLNTGTIVLKSWASHLMFGRNIWFFDKMYEDQYESDSSMHPTNISDAAEFRKIIITIKKFFKLLILSNSFGTITTCNIFSGMYMKFLLLIFLKLFFGQIA